MERSSLKNLSAEEDAHTLKPGVADDDSPTALGVSSTAGVPADLGVLSLLIGMTATKKFSNIAGCIEMTVLNSELKMEKQTSG